MSVSYAASAKARAMYGARLTGEDYRRIAAARGVDGVAAYLRAAPPYTRAMSALPSKDIDREALEDAVKNSMTEEYSRILNFIGPADMAVMRFLAASEELREIMRYICLAASGRAHEYKPSMPEFFARHGLIDYKKLAASGGGGYAGLLDALRGTPYRAPLENLPLRPNGWPEYVKAEIAVRGSYYGWAMSSVRSNYRGARRDALLHAVGIEIDLSNIMAVFRIRRYFPPKREEGISNYLIPISHKLTPAVLKRLLAAPDEPSMLGALRGSGYGHAFSGRVYDDAEGYYYAGMAGLYKRQIRTGKPYVATPLAYLFLKRLETRNVIRLIECVHYGVPAEKALNYVY